MNHSEIMAVCRRGGIPESVHRGHFAVVDTTGRLIAFGGDPHRSTFIRSSAKPLQAVPLIEAGGESKFSLLDREIAITCASHAGEPLHVEAVLSLLRKADMSADRLHCGVHEPLGKAAAEALRERGERPNALHNNCSGKHAGMLALTVLANVSADRYWLPEHPIQQMMLGAVSDICGIAAHRISLAVDGCGVPVFAMPLANLASGYAAFGRPEKRLTRRRAAACRRILAALRKEPFYLAGTARFDTELIRVTGGRLIGKMGAEGVYALTAPESGIGAAVKVEDGAERALYPIVVELLHKLDLLTDREKSSLLPFWRPPLYNRHGKQVGEIVPELCLQTDER